MAKIPSPSDVKPLYSVGLNVVATGSKKMSPSEQSGCFESEPDYVHIIIRDANDKERVLVDEVIPFGTFSTGNLGYKLHVRNQTFSERNR